RLDHLTRRQCRHQSRQRRQAHHDGSDEDANHHLRPMQRHRAGRPCESRRFGREQGLAGVDQGVRQRAKKTHGQDCKFSPVTRWNSRTLLVTSVSPLANACPAMSKSYGPMRLPWRSKSARTFAAASALGWSSANSITVEIKRSTFCRSFAGSCALASPQKSSSTVTIETAQSIGANWL